MFPCVLSDMCMLDVVPYDWNPELTIEGNVDSWYIVVQWHLICIPENIISITYIDQVNSLISWKMAPYVFHNMDIKYLSH